MKKLLTICAFLASTTMFAQNQLQNEATGMITFALDRVAQLADAIPDDKYSWAPSDEVRPVAGVVGHVISVNYFFGSKLGGIMPDGVNPMSIEKDLTTKAELTEALKKSTDFLLAAIKEVDDADLANKVEFPFPGEYTTMSAILIAQGHANEHLGQLIAYARSNGITPPWSAAATADN